MIQTRETKQIALVLLNKGATPQAFRIERGLQAGAWRAAVGGGALTVGSGEALSASVPAHGVEVYVLDAPVADAGLRAQLQDAEARKSRR